MNMHHFRVIAAVLGILVIGVILGRPLYDSADTTDGSDNDGDSDYAMVVHPAPVFNS